MADSVSGVGNSANDFVMTTKVREHQSELGKDEFLKIFLAQLQNQDPTSPVDNTDSIAQMAQFSTLEAMTNLSATYTLTQTYNMIGKGVVGTLIDDAGNRTEIIGTVDSAGVENGVPYVMIGTSRLLAENITQVFDNSIIAGETSTMIAGTAMVGKYARATVTTDGVSAFLEGRVERMSVREGKLYLTIDGREVALNQIVNVAETLEGLGEPDPEIEPEETVPPETAPPEGETEPGTETGE